VSTGANTTMDRYPRILCVSAALALFAGIDDGFAQDLENARRLSERWCAECHAIDSTPGKPDRVPSFASIAAKQAASPEMIASFLLLPHATMPSFPLTRKDVQDLAAFIMSVKK
jgi:mono/diheme cytochrome c family protein